MAYSNAVESASYMDWQDSAALDDRLNIDIDPMSVFAVNQHLMFGRKGELHPFTAKAVEQIRSAGVANDFEELQDLSRAKGLALSEDKYREVLNMAAMLRASNGEGQIGLERSRVEDEMGVPAIALLVVVVAIAFWVVCI